MAACKSMALGHPLFHLSLFFAQPFKNHIITVVAVIQRTVDTADRRSRSPGHSAGIKKGAHSPCTHPQKKHSTHQWTEGPELPETDDPLLLSLSFYSSFPPCLSTCIFFRDSLRRYFNMLKSKSPGVLHIFLKMLFLMGSMRFLLFNNLFLSGFLKFLFSKIE